MSFFEKTRIEHFSSVAKIDMSNALETARNAGSVSLSDRALLNRKQRVHLLCMLHESRMIWGRWLSHYLSEKFCVATGDTHSEPTYLVTLCDINCVTSVDDPKPAISSFKARLSRGLRSLSYLGNLEPAYYTNVQSGSRVDGKKCIFWHLHLIVWGVSRRALQERLDDLERSGKYLAITDQFPGVHMKKIKRGELANTIGYIYKPPANAYRLSIYDGVRYAIPVTLARQGQKRLRPGERIRLFHVMKEISLHELAVAGGDGRPLLAAIKKAAWDECGYTRMKTQEYVERRALKRKRTSIATGDICRKSQKSSM